MSRASHGGRWSAFDHPDLIMRLPGAASQVQCCDLLPFAHHITSCPAIKTGVNPCRGQSRGVLFFRTAGVLHPRIYRKCSHLPQSSTHLVTFRSGPSSSGPRGAKHSAAKTNQAGASPAKALAQHPIWPWRCSDNSVHESAVSKASQLLPRLWRNQLPPPAGPQRTGCVASDADTHLRRMRPLIP